MNTLQLIDYIGVLVFAISGISTAAGKKLDLFGGIIIAFVTAVGGGTLRDILLNTDIVWMEDTILLYIIAAGAGLGILFNSQIAKLRKSFFLFDSIGIGLFTIVGVQKGLELGTPYEIAIILGVISGTFGGVIRDILCTEIPLIFRKEIYATACIAGAIAYSIMYHLQVVEEINLVISVCIVTGIRVASVHYKLSMPIINDKI